MKRFLIALGVFLLLAVIGSEVRSQTESINAGNWKDYVLKVYPESAKDHPKVVKALTPSLIEKKKVLPEKIPAYAIGKVENIELVLIDDNKNGQYNEIGIDVMIFGDSVYGVPVSRVINIKNNLYECNIDAGGGKISLKPYEGTTGFLDMITNFKCPSQLDLLIVNSGEIYLDVARNKKALMPTGNYNVWLGFIQEGTSCLSIKQGAMAPIEVTDESNEKGDKKTTAIKWGAPFKMDFDYSLSNGKVKVPFGSIAVSGIDGEKYFNFTPALLPQVTVIDAKGVIVNKGSFCPS